MSDLWWYMVATADCDSGGETVFYVYTLSYPLHLFPSKIMTETKRKPEKLQLDQQRYYCISKQE